MKKIVTSVGLVALGVSSACAAYAPGLSSMDTSKAWSVSASLRGFYDDNYACWPSSDERDSFGFEISPSIRFNLPLDQTYLGLRYMYSGRYYEDRDGRANDKPWDHAHQVDLYLNHAFSERYTLNLQNSLVIAQEPELLSGSGAAAYPYRTDGDNLRNRASAAFTAQLSRLFSTVISYENVLYDYDDKGETISLAPPGVATSLSGLLDRMEHAASADLRWQALPETTAVVGYRFGAVRYSSDEVIGFLPAKGFMKSDTRDNNTHAIYGGVDQNFLRNLTGSLRLGAQYIDYDEDDVNDNTWIPYADSNLRYSYATGSYVQIGCMHSFNQTDVVAPDPTDGTYGSITSSQESTTLYARLNHQITSKLVGSVQGQYQYSKFDGGLYDSDKEKFLMVGVNLTYLINRHFSAEVGYNFDKLDSDASGDVARRGDYDRNRVYLGVTASY